MGVARSGLWAPGMNHSIPSTYIGAGAYQMGLLIGVKQPTSTGSVFLVVVFIFTVVLPKCLDKSSL